jgi:phosphoribosyl 1,2-cyclic phosphodiesterase
VEEVVGLAASSGVGRVYLFHHDPAHDDACLDRMLAEGKSHARQHRSDLVVDAAREGEEILL